MGKRAAPPDAETDARRELFGGLVLVVLGVGCRLAFASAFPTLPVSDFQGLIRFGILFRDGGLAPPTFLWTQFNPGLPMLLALLYRVLPEGGPEAAREATAVVTGLLGLFPFLLWRGVISLRRRFFAGLLLALWPGQVFFSGVVAQDNWVLLPVVALACLMVRALLGSPAKGHPVASGLLLAAGTAIRQEMLVVLFPLALAASFGSRENVRRSALRLAFAAGLPLLLLAWQRDRATGRFALTTEHGGLAILGTAVPGAWFAGWIDPRPHIASVEPALLANVHRLYAEAGRLGWREYSRRPAFHALRIATQTLRLSILGDASNLSWSLEMPGVLPPTRQASGVRFARAARPWLRAEMAVLQGLFAAALVLGVWKRNRAILVLAAAVLLKVAMHALVSPMSRLLVPATALELLTLPLAAGLLPGLASRSRAALAALAVAVPIALFALVPKLEASVARRDRDDSRAYRFPLLVAGLRGGIWCDMDSGRLPVLDWAKATIEIRSADPAPGDRARVVCALPPLPPEQSLVLRLEDPYSAGGVPGRILERVEIDGREVLRHDIGDQPGAGWLEVPLASEGGARPSRVTIEILAVRPDPGWKWGRAAQTSFEFVRAPAQRPGELRRNRGGP